MKMDSENYKVTSVINLKDLATEEVVSDAKKTL